MSRSSGTGRAAEATEAQIDPEQTSLVRQAGAVRDEARLRHERTRSLWDQKLVSQAEIDAADAELKVADARYQDALEEVYNRIGVLAQRRSELDLARQQLADSALAAPFGGAVRERHASIGQYVPVGQPIVTLVRLHPLRLRLAVPEREAVGLRAGQEVRVAVEGDEGSISGASPG
jgi:multidrug resistance efflux pump